MTPDIRQTVEDIFQTVCELQPSDRAAYLDRACSGDEALRREVEELLRFHETHETFLEEPALQDAARQMAARLKISENRERAKGKGEWTLGPYRVLDQIGRGGMGVVYLARDTRDEKRVAIKVLPVDFVSDEERLARFKREGRMLEELKSLKHPNIAEIYEQAEYDGKPCIVLEYVPGDTLAERLRKGSLPVSEALRIGLQIADALESAHQQRIVHRDLKPANIKITPEGQVKILDFGLAKRFQADFESEETDGLRTRSFSLTESGMLIGTPAYMSPEQWNGQQIDQRTDLWAFGCVLYEMLTGRAPFAAKTRAETMKTVCDGALDLAPLPSGTPLIVIDLLRRCLNRDLDSRLREAGEAKQLIVEAMDRARALLLVFKPLLWKIDFLLGKMSRKTAIISSVSAIVLIIALALVLAWRYTPFNNWAREYLGTAIVIKEGDDLTTILPKKIPGAYPSLVRAALMPDQQTSIDLLEQSDALRKNEDIPNAIDDIITLLNDSIKDGKATAQLYAVLAQAHLFKFYLSAKHEDKEAAIAACKQAQKLNPEKFEVLVALGDLFNAIDSPDQSLAVFNQALQDAKHPNDPYVFYGLAAAYETKGDDDLAESYYQRSIAECEKQPDKQKCWPYFNELGAFYFFRGKYDKAEINWREVIRLNKLSPSGYSNLGNACLYQGCIDEAISLYTQSLNVKETVDGYINRGTAYFFQGKYREAIGDFEAVTVNRRDLSGENDSPKVWGNLGDAYRAENRNDRAIESYQRALQLADARLSSSLNDPEIIALKAEWIAKLRSIGVEDPLQEGPVALIGKALKNDGQNPEYLGIAVLVHYFSNDRDKAINIARKAVEAGYSPFLLKQNPEIIGLRQEKEFQRIIQSFKPKC